jgi:6-phosphogluconate dehydrogenase
MVGLGRMGQNMVFRLAKAGHEVFVTDSKASTIKETVEDKKACGKVVGAESPKELVAKMKAPRAIWLMIPAGITDKVVDLYTPLLEKGDILIDGGNSYYIDDIRRSKALATKGIRYLDVGTSGGVWGYERGYCMMIGGDTAAVQHLDPVFKALAPGQGSTPASKVKKILSAKMVEKDGHKGAEADYGKPEQWITASGTAVDGYLHCGPSGAGHFVKMVHNGIEYALMAAYAEGLNVLQHANVGKASRRADSAEVTPLREPEHYQYDFDIGKIAELWRRGSVVASWLLDLTAEAFLENPELPVEELTVQQHGVPDSGEGRWTLLAAIDEGVPATVLSASLYSRFSSRHEEKFAWKVEQAMRRKFGGH